LNNADGLDGDRGHWEDGGVKTKGKRITIGMGVVAACVLAVCLSIAKFRDAERHDFTVIEVEGWLQDIPDAKKRSEVAIILQEVLNATWPDYQDEEFFKFDGLGDEGTIAFARALRYGGRRAREFAVWYLLRRGRKAEAALPELIDALGDTSGTVRSRAAYTLGDLESIAVKALPQLSNLLKDEDNEVRLAATEAIRAIQGKP